MPAGTRGDYEDIPLTAPEIQGRAQDLPDHVAGHENWRPSNGHAFAPRLEGNVVMVRREVDEASHGPALSFFHGEGPARSPGSPSGAVRSDVLQTGIQIYNIGQEGKDFVLTGQDGTDNSDPVGEWYNSRSTPSSDVSRYSTLHDIGGELADDEEEEDEEHKIREEQTRFVSVYEFLGTVKKGTPVVTPGKTPAKARPSQLSHESAAALGAAPDNVDNGYARLLQQAVQAVAGCVGARG